MYADSKGAHTIQMLRMTLGEALPHVDTVLLVDYPYDFEGIERDDMESSGLQAYLAEIPAHFA
jgi:hypothetical protein